MIKIFQKPIFDPDYFEELWEREMIDRPWKYDERRHIALLEPLNSHMRILDVAAGVYGTVQFIAERMHCPDLELYAVDRSSTAKRMVREMCPRIKYLTSVLPTIPHKDQYFDMVIATQILEHMVEPHRLVWEMARVCKPGGWLCMAAVDRERPHVLRHGPWPGQQWWIDGYDMVALCDPFGKSTFDKVGDYFVLWCKIYE